MVNCLISNWFILEVQLKEVPTHVLWLPHNQRPSSTLTPSLYGGGLHEHWTSTLPHLYRGGGFHVQVHTNSPHPFFIQRWTTRTYNPTSPSPSHQRWTTCTNTQSQVTTPSPSHLIFLRVVDFIHKYIQPHPQPIFIRVDYMNQHPPSPMSPHFFMVNYMYCTLYK